MQFGFQPGKSCVAAIVNILEKIESAFKANKFVLVIYLDLAGAFDGAWHPAIINGLMERKCLQTYVSLINSCLSNRVVQLNLGNASVSKNLSMSAPQGATLSPFLWNIDMDDNLTIDYELTNNNDNTQAFADDSQLCIINDILSELESSANLCLNKLELCANFKKMNFSPDKCKAVIYTRKRGTTDINLKFKNESITVTKCEPY